MSNKRLSKEDGIRLFAQGNLLKIGQHALDARNRMADPHTVTYIIDRNINYTNICISGCSFCAFWRSQKDESNYLLDKRTIFNKIKEAIKLGATQILMQGGLHPTLKLNYYTELLKSIKAKFNIHIHSFSPPEIIHIAKVSKLHSREVLQALMESGLDSLPGGGAEILVDRVRKRLSPNKCTSDEWLNVMRESHKLGLRTTATMMFGHIETPKDRIEHLIKIRKLQDETGGFTAFIPWTYQPQNTRPVRNKFLNRSRLGGTGSGGSDYFKTLAISRLMLDNIPNIQASWVTQGPKIGQLALFFGANDLGSIMIEENVVRSAGTSYTMTKEEIVRLIKDAGFKPKQRRTSEY